MNLPAAILVLRCLIRDTFRQSLASGIFWLMLGVSVLCTLFCLSAGVSDSEILHKPDELTEFLPRHDRAAKDAAKVANQGVDVVRGDLTLAFGAIRLPLGRDAEDSVRFLQLILAGGVADALGLLLALVWTAGFLPAFLEPSAASVLLSKPLPRWALLAGKYAGVLAFVGFQSIVFVGATWFALGFRTGIWVPEYWLCVPMLLCHFAIMYSASAFLAVCTRNTVACVFGSLLFWLLCWGMNFARHSVVALPSLDPNTPSLPTSFQRVVETGYWILPKPADFSILLQNALGARDHFAGVPAFQYVQQMGAFYPELSVLSSLLFAVALLAISARQLVTTDY